MLACTGIYNIAYDSLPLYYLEGKNLTNALAHYQSLNNLTLILGGACAGLLISWVGVKGCLWINAFSFLVPAIIVISLNIAICKQVKKSGPFLKESLHGFHMLWKIPGLRYTIWCALAGNLI